MCTFFEKIESCQRSGTVVRSAALATLTELLADADWRVRYAAVIAAGDLRAVELVPRLVSVLRDEDVAPLYAQPGDLSGGPAGANTPMKAKLDAADPVTLDAWRRRGRIKQAVLWALADIGHSSAEVRAFLHRYAVDQKEDYAVRAAACRALGVLGDASSVGVLEQAATDGDWCTNCEAKKSLRALKKSA